ncbi:MAG: ABC transporter permease [Chloroflexi bacterium]|jgi:ABC-2 type transport system permease protein|nr:ABC transporter permease [Chloroflexota bacterium]
MPGKKTADARIIFEEEFSRQIRRTGWRVFTVGVPVLMLFFAFILPMIMDRFGSDGEGGDSVGEAIGFIDHSDVAENLEPLPGLIRIEELDDGRKALVDGDIKSLFVIPDDYLLTGEVDWYRIGSGLASDDNTGDAFHNVLRIAVADDALTDAQITRLISPASYKLFKVDELGQTDTSSSLKDEIGKAAPAFIFAMMLMMSIFVGSGSLLQSVTEEKENRMVEMLVTSTSSMAIMVGKVLGLGAAGLLQIAIWLTVAAISVPQISDQFSGLSSLSVEPDLIILMIAFYFAGYFVFAALMASIGAASTSVREASQISAIVMVPAIVPIYASALIIPNPDGTLARVLTFFPLTSPTASMMRIAGGTDRMYEVVLGLVVTALAGIFLMWLSARVFRAGLLLYGQRMSIRSVWGALRQSG